jgi:hypothetical protein
VPSDLKPEVGMLIIGFVGGYNGLIELQRGSFEIPEKIMLLTISSQKEILNLWHNPRV